MAKFFVKGNTTKVDGIKGTDAYKNSIILDTEKKVIYQNNIKYGHSDAEISSTINTSLGGLTYFSKVSDGTNQAQAPGTNSILKFTGTNGVTASVSNDGVTITGPTLPTLSSLGAVPTSRTVTAGGGLTGGGNLTANRTISHATATPTIATDGEYVTGITVDEYGHIATVTKGSTDLSGYVPTSRTICNKALTDNITLSASDVSAVPTTRKVNAKALSSDITLTGADLKLTGYAKGTDVAIAAADTINQAFGKTQGQIDALKTKTDGLTGAMHFKGVETTLPAVTSYSAGDVVIVNGIEYVLTGADSNKTWEEFGDQSRIGQIETAIANLEGKPGLDKVGTVTSVGVTVPTGLQAGAAVTSSGNIAISFASGYSIPTTAKQTTWDSKVSFPGFGTAAPNAAGTAAVGTATTAAKSDHVHPAQTTITGNAGSATKLQTSRTISITGDGAGSGSFDGSADLSIELSLEWEEL